MEPFISLHPVRPYHSYNQPIPNAEALRKDFFKPGNQGSTEVFMVNTWDPTTGRIRPMLDTDGSKPKVIERKGEDHLYPFQIWLLKVADDEVLLKHKDIIESDYTDMCALARQYAGSFDASREAKGWAEKVVKEAKSEVEYLKTMIKEMNEFQPRIMGLTPEMHEQKMYAEAQDTGKFGRG
ncbi:hypothetical protein CLAFUW4_06850 [Fulvia fulva]|uniref:Uncharacterized protein n=1 Tax=Passalora fulva TaxID=5499 RepID=A0A9Q8PAE6_PASFU|nr:uncharacterized protein CLAFUR5_06987 [Fulvia fulva]KAK4621336.1 hypothetical protein CLAFUR4_06858 [Fulvia fulva]KAK4623449.1 hypothetical protein CLAFUR0_06854 [Fulvia fulva]UJO18838.1 hypothetical protein CLAFUR5_06987 [Fulvia fulva]WPV16759.1 hypothetical protein CLAFUW4_06850 [Fulvia fulva]WPV30730.1 hypothetical protein CLAFUW7_06849 [Fulvia fulva]